MTRLDPRPPQKPPASTGLGIKLGDLMRRNREQKQKKESKKP